MVARKLKVAKKAKVSFSRRKSTGFAAAPQSNFRDFNDYCRTDLDKKDCSSKIKSYLKLTLPKAQAQIALQAPEWAFTSIPFVAATIAWKEMKNEFPVFPFHLGFTPNRSFCSFMSRSSLSFSRRFSLRFRFILTLFYSDLIRWF